ncbi:UvrD-helicase domain-containing protein [Palleronia sp. KMU-117]|uniref:UvrD-helicase domain-containing protein n=1 Tax=Palleronia sp. KMU-117 TaxID=3434108 RepID=UPI003D76259C
MTQLEARPLLGFLIDPLFRRPRALRLKDDGIAVQGGGLSWVGFEGLAAAPTVTRGLLSSTLHLPVIGEKDVRLTAAGKGAARAFAAEAEDAWRRFNTQWLKAEMPRIERVLSTLAGLESPKRYPSACLLRSTQEEAADLHRSLLSRLSEAAIGPDQWTRLAPISRFATDPTPIRDAAIERYVNAELDRWRDFLDAVESKPLTPEQRLSVVVDEDATLVLAGAGSGKTSVITAKAAYLIKAGIRTPDEILLLAFARDAAKEMSERIEARCGVPVEARTFHALSYDIIGTVEGTKPALAPHASDDMAFLALIKAILRDLVAAASEVAQMIVGWFAHFFDDPRAEWDFKTKHAWYSEVEKLDLRTLQGEKVKSFEELQIANWLYRNGIAYEYEPTYEHTLPGNGKRVYKPDFRLTESGVYIEHFGVRKQRMPDGTERLVTAPFVDREEYLEGMEWKRQVHAEHGTTLIETYSWERSEGRLLDALAKKLAPYVTLRIRPPDEIYDRVVEMGSVDGFSSLLGTFLRHYKSGGYTAEACAQKAEKLKMGKRAQAFLTIFTAVFTEYQKRLGAEIDFEDMVGRATDHVEAGRYRSPFRHILVDEFQDIAAGRARLIRALKAQHADARVFAVGDDWQSIYRFAGSDIHIMRNFGREFGGSFAGETGIHRSVDLGRTFRSVDKIALPARHFVLRNPAQITKTVVPAGVAEQPAIKVVWTRKDTGGTRLDEVLSEISATAKVGEQKPSVLLLGRYRKVDPGAAALQRRFPGLSISYKTIHSSKGLEADHVILLRADSGRSGFPSEMVDDPLLSLVSPEAEPFENAEERRVMYVAMTRARHTLTIFASEARPSAFVTELIEDPAYGLSGPGGVEDRTHTCGECGGRLLFMPSQEGRSWYRCEHIELCGNRLPSCPACGEGLPRHVPGQEDLVCAQCGAAAPSCPKCSDGWLVERSGRYGAFLGCVRFPECEGKGKIAKSN